MTDETVRYISIIDAEVEDTTDAQRQSSILWHIFGTECPKVRLSVSGHLLVQGHRGKHIQPVDRSRYSDSVDGPIEQFVVLPATQFDVETTP